MLTIRRAEKTDSSALISHLNRINKDKQFLDCPQSGRESELAVMQNSLSSGETVAFLGFEKGVVRAHCSGFRLPNNTLLCSIGVESKFRYTNQKLKSKRGMSDCLLEQLVNWAQEQKSLVAIVACIYTNNHPSRKLFERNGFKFKSACINAEKGCNARDPALHLWYERPFFKQSNFDDIVRRVIC